MTKAGMVALVRFAGASKCTMTKLQKTKKCLMSKHGFPIFLYDVETWSLLETDKKHVDALKMWMWRRMFRITWTAQQTKTPSCESPGVHQPDELTG